MSLDPLVADLSNLTVNDLVALKKALEARWGVSATQQVIGVTPGPSQEQPAEPAVEQTEFNVRLTEIGGQKITVIKVVRELIPTLTLIESKAKVEATPTDILEAVPRERADEAASRLRAAGATVEIQ